MPNWCANVAEFHHPDESTIDALVAEAEKKDKSGIFQHLRPGPEEWDYSWCVENWGCKWDTSPHDVERIDANTVKLVFDTAWGPPVTLYYYLVEQGWDVRAYYYEPGMAFAGQFTDGFDDSYEYGNMSAAEMAEHLPQELDEMFAISEQQREWEEENEDEENSDEAELDFAEVTDASDQTVEHRVARLEQELAQLKKQLAEQLGYVEPDPEQALRDALEELRAEFEQLVANDGETESAADKK